MNKEEIIKLLESNRPPCIETLRGSLVEFNEEDRIMVMEFDAIPEFCHSEAQSFKEDSSPGCWIQQWRIWLSHW